jgi:hypothetical protein
MAGRGHQARVPGGQDVGIGGSGLMMGMLTLEVGGVRAESVGQVTGMSRSRS